MAPQGHSKVRKIKSAAETSRAPGRSKDGSMGTKKQSFAEIIRVVI